MINNYLETQIKENFPYEPTFEQEIVLKSLAAFLLSPRNDAVFVLRGYAGTGKTSLVGALVRTLDKLQQKSILLAPTGRAAKVFSAYAGHPAFTIHKKIYRQQSFSNEVSNFSVNDNLSQLLSSYIVCHCAVYLMICDSVDLGYPVCSSHCFLLACAFACSFGIEFLRSQRHMVSNNMTSGPYSV